MKGNMIVAVALVASCPVRASYADSAVTQNKFPSSGMAKTTKGRDEIVRGQTASAWAYFRANGITEIRYVRFPSYIADAKPVRVLDVCRLSPQRDGDTLSLLDKADVGSWKACYEDERVSDGMRWTVEIVAGDKVVKRIDGFNAEPPGLRFLLRACGLDRDSLRRTVPEED